MDCGNFLSNYINAGPYSLGLCNIHANREHFISSVLTRRISPGGIE
jgi:hypothetical protein